jgi:hypothetical protein
VNRIVLQLAPLAVAVMVLALREGRADAHGAAEAQSPRIAGATAAPTGVPAAAPAASV